MRNALLLTCSLAAVATFAAPVLPAQAQSNPVQARHSSAPARQRSVHAYVNPFVNRAWKADRTDMGMDWLPRHNLPVLAIGDAVILGSDDHAAWLGHHSIWYRLLDGSHAGDIVFVAEHLKNLVRVGRHVRAGQQIAVALPGFPWTEWGWANAQGFPRAYPCYSEGVATNSGREMERFLISLGASAGDRPGRGPDRPVGKLC